MLRRALRHGAFTLCVCLSGGKEGGFAKTPFFLSSSPWAERGSLRFGRTGRDKSLHRQGFHIQIQRGDAGPQQCVAKIPHGEWPARTRALRDVLQAKLGLVFHPLRRTAWLSLGVHEERGSASRAVAAASCGAVGPAGWGCAPRGASPPPGPQQVGGRRPAPPGAVLALPLRAATRSRRVAAGRGAAVGPQPRGAVGCPGRAVP